jgi:hypothetical protein
MGDVSLGGTTLSKKLGDLISKNKLGIVVNICIPSNQEGRGMGISIEADPGQ